MFTNRDTMRPLVMLICLLYIIRFCLERTSYTAIKHTALTTEYVLLCI